MNHINKENLKQLIEPHFFDDLIQDVYTIIKINANQLLTHTRFDLAFKLLYLDMMQKDVKFANEIYKEHIRAFSLGNFTEPGNNDKNSAEKFIEDFYKTFEDIKANGFNSNKTLIPLSKNGSIANGAHRVASAIVLNKEVECVQINSGNHIYDYKFFYSRNVSSEVLDVIATKFVEYADNIYIAFIWPTALGHDKEIAKIIPNIVYKKEVKLNSNGAHNLLSQIYYGEDWLGNIENNFKGSQGKLIECFKTFNPIRVVAFQANGLDEVLKIKDKIRDVFKVGKHSIHITDTKEEAIRVARVVFNDNSIHFLNYAKPNRYISTHTKIDKFKEFIAKNELDANDVTLDSGIILSAYGLRKSSDIDYFVDDNEKLKYNDEELEYHDEELEYHDEEKLELIYNPKNYFYFNDLKFVSFNQLYKMKKNRNKEKDINDYKMMEALIADDKFKAYINKIKQNILYTKIKIRQKLIHILKIIGVHAFLKKLLKGNQ